MPFATDVPLRELAARPDLLVCNHSSSAPYSDLPGELAREVFCEWPVRSTW